MKPHRHAWVDCTHKDEQGEWKSCGLLRCIHCGAKRRPAPKPTEDHK